jgi:Ni/Co efflux regulator RcnB
VGWIIFIVVIALVALALLLREPFAEFRDRRRERAQERKREWRRQREAEKERRRVERAMNPAKAAAKKGPPRWQQVAERQGSKCWLCGTRTFPDDRRRIDVGEERYGATYPTVDYVVALDRGGTYAPDNVRIAHRHCAQVRAQNPARTEFGPPKRTYAP